MYIFIYIDVREYVHFARISLAVKESCGTSVYSFDRRDVCSLFSFLLGSRFLERTVIYPWRACFPYGPSNLERTVEEEPGPVLWEHTRLNTCVSLPAAGRKSL